METNWSFDHGNYRIQSGRVTASYKFDLGKWFGRHGLAALYETGRSTSESYPGAEILVDDNNVPIFNAAQPEHNDNRLIRRQYITLGQFDTYYLGDPREAVSLGLNGKRYHNAFVNQNLNRTKMRQETESVMASTQNGFMLNLLDGRVFLRGTAYKTAEEKRVAATLVAGGFGARSNYIFDALLASGRITAAEHEQNYFGSTGQITSVADVENDGYVYNVTDEDVFPPLRYNTLFSGYARSLLKRPRNFRLTFGIDY